MLTKALIGFDWSMVRIKNTPEQKMATLLAAMSPRDLRLFEVLLSEAVSDPETSCSGTPLQRAFDRFAALRDGS